MHVINAAGWARRMRRAARIRAARAVSRLVYWIVWEPEPTESVERRGAISEGLRARPLR